MSHKLLDRTSVDWLVVCKPNLPCFRALHYNFTAEVPGFMLLPVKSSHNSSQADSHFDIHPLWFPFGPPDDSGADTPLPHLLICSATSRRKCSDSDAVWDGISVTLAAIKQRCQMDWMQQCRSAFSAASNISYAKHLNDNAWYWRKELIPSFMGACSNLSSPPNEQQKNLAIRGRKLSLLPVVCEIETLLRT